MGATDVQVPASGGVAPAVSASAPTEISRSQLEFLAGRALTDAEALQLGYTTTATLPGTMSRQDLEFLTGETYTDAEFNAMVGGGGGPGGNPPVPPTGGNPADGGSSWFNTRNVVIGSAGGGVLFCLISPSTCQSWVNNYLTAPQKQPADKNTIPPAEVKKTGGGPEETPPPEDDKTVRPPGGPKACGPNDTYASSGCYPPYGTRTTSEIPSSGDYCISSIEPLVVVPGVKPGPNCYNYSGSKNPLSSLGSTLGQLLGRLFSTTQPAPTQGAQPAKPPVTPPVATSTPAKPYATLVANPSSVATGGKSRVIWTSANTSGCELFAPDNFLMATGTRGSTSTLPLATTTAFSLDCRAPSGATTTASTTVSVR